MRLIVGLGNPGKTYQWSKHNMGFLCLDAYAKAHNLTFAKEAKFLGEIVKGETFVLLKPRTFMNLSGQSVRAVADYFKIAPADILVVSDDMDIPLFKIRIREQGSAGGHNGLKSIIEHLVRPTASTASASASSVPKAWTPKTTSSPTSPKRKRRSSKACSPRPTASSNCSFRGLRSMRS
ncbi:MAG: aminoacyl-tRNA hydrolase [Bacillus subtilis]|nr:aminoacyl-tRNA hydrolase [Bacillus subtilis]